MTLATKNGIPWTSLYKFDEPVRPEYLTQLKNIWTNENWGDKYENYKRPPLQSAIYPCTRRVLYNSIQGSSNKDLITVTDLLCKDLLKLFDRPMSFLFAELVLLTPYGIVPWHHDRMTLCSLATRVMVPLTDHYDPIKYYFCSWNNNTPTVSNFDAVNHLNVDVYEHEMMTGHYYVFNHRVPHMTISKSSKPRGLLQVEVIPTEIFENYVLDNQKIAESVDAWATTFSPINDLERIKLLPAML